MNHMKQSCRGGLGGIRSVTAFIANIAVSLALIAVLSIMVIWPFGGSHRPTVEVHDEAGILRTEPLAKKIQEMRFRQDLHVAVLTVPGWDVTNLNDSVLEYARSHASDTDVPWISTSNPNYWSDGLVILAVAPEARKVGCYFGEDVAVPWSSRPPSRTPPRNSTAELTGTGALSPWRPRPPTSSVGPAVATWALPTSCPESRRSWASSGSGGTCGAVSRRDAGRARRCATTRRSPTTTRPPSSWPHDPRG